MRMRAVNPEESTPDRCRRSNRALLRLRQRRPQEKRRTADPGGRWRRPLARMRISAVLHPAVLLAFLDGVRLAQRCDRLSAQCADRRSPFLRRQHLSSLLRNESFSPSFVPGCYRRAGIAGCRVDCFFICYWGKASLRFSRGLASPMRAVFRRALMIVKANLPNHGACTGK
jgi:hypothetical protein